MKEKSITKNIFFNIIYTGSNVIFPLITSMYIARILGPENSGRVFYAQNIASYFVIFAGIGLPSYGVREISKVRNDSKKTNKLFSELMILQLIATAVASLIYLLLVFSIKALNDELLLFICVGIQIFMNFLNVDWLYQGREDYKYITLRSVIVKTISLIAILISIRSKSDYILYALISSFSLVLNFLFNIIHARKFVKFTFRNISFSHHAKPIITFTLIILLSTIYSKIDVTMLGSLSSKRAIGYYSYAQRIIQVVLSICNAATSVFMPRLSWYYKSNNDEFLKLIYKGIGALLFIVCPIAMGLFLIAPQLISLLFGHDFVQAAYTLRIFIPLVVIKSFGDLLCYQVVISTNNEQKNIFASLIGSSINVILNAILIPIYAERGAAVASVAAEFALNLYLIIWSYHTIRFSLNKKAMYQAIVSSMIMGLFVELIIKKINLEIFTVIISIIVGVSIYLACNFLLRNDFLLDICKKTKSRFK